MTDDPSRAARPLSLDSTSWPDLPPVQAARLDAALTDYIVRATDEDQQRALFSVPLCYDATVARDPHARIKGDDYTDGVYLAVGRPVAVPVGWHRSSAWHACGATPEAALAHLDERLADFYEMPTRRRTITHGPPWPDDRAHLHP